MDIASFGKACAALENAKSKLEQMNVARDLRSLSSLWSEYLTEVQRFYTRMVIACKQGPSSAWWGSIKSARNSDPLLQYLHQARHADEHGISEITEAEPGSILIDGRDGTLSLRNLSMKDGRLSFEADRPHNVEVTFEPARLHLIPVYNRGKCYDPPTRHLDKDIADGGPLSVASLAIEYLEGVRDHAEKTYRPRG